MVVTPCPGPNQGVLVMGPAHLQNTNGLALYCSALHCTFLLKFGLYKLSFLHFFGLKIFSS